MSGEAAVRNGWVLYGHPVFLARLTALLEEVESLWKNDPRGFHREAVSKLLQCVRHCIFEEVPASPKAKAFMLGKTLGVKNGHWRRAKKRLPPRYRLFFQFRSKIPQTIIYAWLNDETTLRKDGAKTDVYAVFQRMLASGKMPGTFSELEKVAGPVTAPKTA